MMCISFIELPRGVRATLLFIAAALFRHPTFDIDLNRGRARRRRRRPPAHLRPLEPKLLAPEYPFVYDRHFCAALKLLSFFGAQFSISPRLMRRVRIAERTERITTPYCAP